MRWDSELADGATELVPLPSTLELSPVMRSCYPEAIGDLSVLWRLLRDLQSDLTRSADTVARHSGALQQLGNMIATLAERHSGRLTRDQFVDFLRSNLGQLRGLEEDLSSSSETVGRHGFKLQNLDLAMQLLTEVVVATVTNGVAHPMASARLHNLRDCCRQALNGA
jgi:hypothetical protein